MGDLWTIQDEPDCRDSGGGYIIISKPLLHRGYDVPCLGISIQHP